MDEFDLLGDDLGIAITQWEKIRRVGDMEEEAMFAEEWVEYLLHDIVLYREKLGITN